MAPREDSALYRFDEFQLDPIRGVVLGSDGVELHLRPKAFALMRYLLDNPGRLLGREELLDALWPDVVVTDDSLTQCMSDLRHAFGPRAPKVLRTIPKRGYMLAAEVRRDAVPRQEPAPAASFRDPAVLRQDTLAIHRFETPDGDRACVLVADTLATDLMATFTRMEGLRVLSATNGATGATFRLKGEVRAAGSELRVSFLLEDGMTGAALWAERLDQPRDGSPELPGATLTTLAAHIDKQVGRHSLSVARGKPTADLTARELCLIGRDHHQRGTEADTQIAKELFARAIELDPDFASAYAWQAYTVHRAITHGWGSPGGQAARDESLRLARRAVQLQPDSPLCLSRLAFSLVLHQRWEEAVDTARAALASVRPALSSSRNTCGEVLAAAGFPEEAAAVAQATIALDPLCPPTTQGILGRALLLSGKTEEALPPLRWCASRLPDYAATYDSLLVAALESGRIDEALAARREFFRIKPGWVPQNHTGFWFFRREEDVRRFLAAYRRAAELAEAADGQQAAPGAARPAGGAQPPPSTLETLPTPPPEFPGAQTPASLRREVVFVHPMQVLSADERAVRAAPVLTSGLVAELVRYEELRVVTGLGERVTQGFAAKGDVHSADGLLAAVVRLEDLATGAALWADRVEWASDQSGGPPPETLSSFASAIEVQIGRASVRRARDKPEGELSARETTLLGQVHFLRCTEAETEVARQLFVRATTLDPGYTPALAGQAFTITRSVMNDWSSADRHEAVAQAVRLARRAVELEPESSTCLAALSMSLAMQDRWDEAVAAARLALPKNRIVGVGARAGAGDVLAAAGHPAEAEEAVRYAITRNPHGSPFVRVVLGRALLLSGRAEEAVGELRRCAAQLPDYALCFRTLVVAAFEAGLVDDAREAFRQLHRLRPDWAEGTKPIYWFVRREADRERYQRAFEMVMHLDATARAGGLLKSPESRA